MKMSNLGRHVAGTAILIALDVSGEPGRSSPISSGSAGAFVPARVIVNGTDTGSASLVGVGSDCVAITALHVLAIPPDSSAVAATMRLANGREALATVRRRIPSIDIALMTVNNPSSRYAGLCVGAFHVGDTDAALRSVVGTVQIARDAGNIDEIPVQLDGPHNANEINVCASSPRLNAGVSGSPLLFAGQLVGVVTDATHDGSCARAQRIDAITAAARDDFNQQLLPPAPGPGRPDKKEPSPISPTSLTKEFVNPIETNDNWPIASCLHSSADDGSETGCGKPAADSYCRSVNMSSSVSYSTTLAGPIEDLWFQDDHMGNYYNPFDKEDADGRVISYPVKFYKFTKIVCR